MQSVSVYKNSYDTDCVHCSMDSVINRIRSGARGRDSEKSLAEKTQELRRLYTSNSPRYKPEKEKSTAVTWAGTFPSGERLGKKLIQHSGYVVLDIDNDIDVTEQLEILSEHPNVAILFVSPSGAGVKPVIPVYPIPKGLTEHKVAFNVVLKVFSEYVVDDPKELPKQSDPNRLCYLAHDPNVVDRREIAKPVSWSMPVDPDSDSDSDKAYDPPTVTEAREMLKYLSAEVYSEWIEVGMACKDAGLPVSVWNEWSQSSAKYKAGECEKKWESFKGTGWSWGSVVYLAKEQGYRGGNRKRKSNPVREMKDASDYFVGTDFNVLAMSEHIQGNFRVWSQDSGIYIYDDRLGVYVPGEMEIDKAVRDALGSLRKKRYVEEVLADLASTCRRDVPDTSDLIGFKNGVLRLNTDGGSGLGDFSPHSPDNYLMSTYPVDFNPSAPETEGSKDFSDWLLDVLGGDSGLWCLLYEVIGSIFHRASVDMQRGVLLIGEGGTGKSMFLSQVERMTGRNNICARDWGEYGRDAFAFAGLYQKSLALGADLDVGRSLSGAIKPAVTGNTLNCNEKHQKAFDFNPYATWIGSINRFPRTKDKTWGFFRRWIAVPFNKRFETNAQFEQAKRALWSQPETMSRIVYDALRLYVVAYQNGNYTVPESAAALSREMHRASNSVITWLDERTIPDEDGIVERQKAYADYAGFCLELDTDAESNRIFYDTLRSQGYSVDKYDRIDGKTTRVIQGFQIAATEVPQ